MNGKVLVAGIGNIFLGDDAFGVEVTNAWSNAYCHMALASWTLAFAVTTWLMR